ncbi:putative ribonuclease H protein, partial [Trifolium medium]|nr:putative ribonuclease H protein [Trifolium medium]
MDKLSHLIIEAVEGGNWQPIKAGRSGPFISHLMFADDLLLFGKATEVNMQIITDTLEKFCQLSGKLVSIEKTSVLFSKNVPRDLREVLLQQSGFREANSLGKYLGIPLMGRAPRHGDFEHLVDKVRSKLSGWKTTNLSFAGRVTLAKSVIQAIPIYSMMTT